MTDPFVGQLCFIRVYSGKLNAGDSIYNVSQGQARANRPSGEDARQQARGDPGDSGRRHLRGGRSEARSSPATRSAIEKRRFCSNRSTFPAPVIQLAIEPKTKADQEKLGVAINKLATEDPTLQVSTDPETGQTILAGMGELHLEIIVDRMQREFNVDANVGKPQVAYRETIRQAAEYDYTHKKQTGGSGQYARVKLRVEPDPEKDFEFVERVTGGNIPREFIPAVEKGVAEALEGGVLAGYPIEQHQGDGVRRRLSRSRLVGNGVQDLRLSICFKEACRESEAGSARAGDARRSHGSRRVHGSGERRPDFAARAVSKEPRSRAARTSSRRWFRCRKCSVMPPSLRSRTQGRGSFTMHFGQYEEVPRNVAEEIVNRVQERYSRQVRIVMNQEL